MRKTSPQYELPGTSEPFNLSGQSALDGERVAAEQKQAKADREASAKLQPELTTMPGLAEGSVWEFEKP